MGDNYMLFRYILAVCNGDYSMVKYLHKKNQQLIVMDHEFTTLHIAVEKAYFRIVRFFLNHGADPNTFSHSQKATPLHLTRERRHISVARILIRSGADVNAKDHHGNTPLHVVTLSGNTALMRLLLVSGAKVNARNNEDLTPMHMVASGDIADYKKRVKLAKVLQEYNAQLNVQDQWGRTPLHYAYWRKRKKLVKFLEDCGARSWCADKLGQTPRDYTNLWGPNLHIENGCKTRLPKNLHQPLPTTS